MLHILYVIITGFCIGHLAKMVHPGEEPEGFWGTTAVGIFGSVTGQMVAGLTGCHDNIFFSVAGGILVCAFWRWYKHNAA
jgi:uncharacterized membrane protein YeaQ/YmgE (transglycosylase-associated protein family)